METFKLTKSKIFIGICSLIILSFGNLYTLVVVLGIASVIGVSTILIEGMLMIPYYYLLSRAKVCGKYKIGKNQRIILDKSNRHFYVETKERNFLFHMDLVHITNSREQNSFLEILEFHKYQANCINRYIKRKMPSYRITLSKNQKIINVPKRVLKGKKII